MSSFYGEKLKIAVFGESHTDAIGVTIDGLPAGFHINIEELTAFMARRAPGRNELSTARREADMPQFLCGILNDTTCGTPLTAIIQNTDARSDDYDELRYVPRPGHADLTAQYKYGGAQDTRGGGHFSGRLTAPLCIAGGIALQILRSKNVRVSAHIKSIAGISDEDMDENSAVNADFPVIDVNAGVKMRRAILNAAADGDSVGGTVECMITGLPAGLGSPIFDGIESRIASIIFSIPAVKGVEFGAGFRAAELRGSENNDKYVVKDGKIITETNNCGGILGGITNGMPVVFRAAFKPTPSIGKKQKSVDLRTLEVRELEIHGRHDPCIVPRAVPVVEAAAAVAMLDAVL